MKEHKKKTSSNKEITVVIYGFLILFVLLIGYFIYFNIFQSEKVINNAHNKRQESFAEDVIKGQILDSNGEVLATTIVGNDGSESRYYPYGKIFAHVVGYDEQGRSGLEADYSFNMLRSNSSIFTRLNNDLNNQKSMGDNVVTTLDAKLQQAAYSALGENKGAVVVIDVKTGKILTMVSKPAYDPNNIAQNWQSITETYADQGLLLNRATQGLYPPGSTFKMVTLLEYIREHPDNYSDYHYNCKGYAEDGDFKLTCINRTVHGEQNLIDSFANSCNSAFSTIGLGLDRDKYASTAEDLLFNSELPLGFNYSHSSFTLNKEDNNAMVMMTAMGQGKTLVSPVHMAMIASAIGNKGILMNPYLVDHIENDAGLVVSSNSPKEYGRLITEKESTILTEHMKEVVNRGSVRILLNDKYTVAGKTGTAEYNTEKGLEHTWFVGYSSTEDADIAFAVLVEGGGTDGVRATAVTKQVLDSYYNR